MTKIKSKHLTSKMLILILSLFLITGCSLLTTQTKTFKTDSGEKVALSLDTTSGYKLSDTQGLFIVSKKDKAISRGIFIKKETYESYVEWLDKKTGNKKFVGNTTKIIEDKETDNIKYIYYSSTGASGIEYNHVGYIKDSNTGFLINNTVSGQTARECFNLLSFKIK